MKTSTGFYGKIPAVGDFVQRRLPSSFIEPWDEWLQQSIAVSREQLGEQWLKCYLNAPIWRFVLSAGVCGPEAYAGIFIPSVDAVGRYYPLTFSLAVPNQRVFNRAFDYQNIWFVELENLALEVLQQKQFSLEQLDRALINLLAPNFAQIDNKKMVAVNDFCFSLWWVTNYLEVTKGAFLCCHGLPDSAFSELLAPAIASMNLG